MGRVLPGHRRLGRRLILVVSRIDDVPVAHMYLFSDACPTDWLSEGKDETWHTIANFTFQSDPAKQAQVDAGVPHSDILGKDSVYTDIIERLESQLPSGRLHKWKTGPGYKERFCRAVAQEVRTTELMFSACSFQERTLRNAKVALLASYNKHLGGIEGRGIGFEEWRDDRNHLRMKHSFVNFNGYHEIVGLEGQVMVLLFMSWFVADQFIFHSKQLQARPSAGFDSLRMTVVSDRLSGDDDTRLAHEANLRRLIDPAEEYAPIVLTRSPVSDSFSGDLLVDNLAGWLTAAMEDPASAFADTILQCANTGVWRGWHILGESQTTLESVPALDRLSRRN